MYSKEWKINSPVFRIRGCWALSGPPRWKVLIGQPVLSMCSGLIVNYLYTLPCSLRSKHTHSQFAHAHLQTQRILGEQCECVRLSLGGVYLSKKFLVRTKCTAWKPKPSSRITNSQVIVKSHINTFQYLSVGHFSMLHKFQITRAWVIGACVKRGESQISSRCRKTNGQKRALSGRKW